MDRVIAYTQEQAQAIDVLQGQMNAYLSSAAFMQAIIGDCMPDGCVSRMLCTPTAVPSLAVTVGPGELYSTQPTDVTNYGDATQNIPADPTPILKQGIFLGGDFSTPAPVTPGDSVIYLIQAQFQENDGDPQLRPFFGGPPQTVNFLRQDIASLEVKAGTPAPSPVAPTPDAGFIGLWLVTVAYGQTTVTTGDIAIYSAANFFGAAYNHGLQNTLTQAEAAATYLTIANAASTYLTIANAAATYLTEATANTLYTPNPATGSSDEYWAVFSIPNTHLTAGLIQLPINYVSGDPSFISSNVIVAPFNCVVFVTFFVSPVSGEGPANIFINYNGGTNIGGGSIGDTANATFTDYAGVNIVTAYPLSTGNHLEITASTPAIGECNIICNYGFITVMPS